MAAAYPADFLGLAESRGRLAPGLRADLVWLDDDLQRPRHLDRRGAQRRVGGAVRRDAHRLRHRRHQARRHRPRRRRGRSARACAGRCRESFDGVVDAVAEMVGELATAGVHAPGVGVSLPGVITRDGEISMIVNLPWLEGQPLAPSPGSPAGLPGCARQRRQLLRPLRSHRWRRRRGRGGVRGHPRHRRGRRAGGAGRGPGGRQRQRRRVGPQSVAHAGGRRRALRLRALRPGLRRDLAQRGGARARLRSARGRPGHGRTEIGTRAAAGRHGRRTPWPAMPSVWPRRSPASSTCWTPT